MQKLQTGFTLIELVVVIVLLGILGVTALGKFQDLSDQAQNAANEGVAAELSAASNINYAARLIDPTFTGSIDLSGAVDCSTDLGGLFAIGYPTGYTFTGAANCALATVDSVTCTVNLAAPNASTVDGTAIVLCTN